MRRALTCAKNEREALQATKGFALQTFFVLSKAPRQRVCSLSSGGGGGGGGGGGDGGGGGARARAHLIYASMMKRRSLPVKRQKNIFCSIFCCALLENFVFFMSLFKSVNLRL